MGPRRAVAMGRFFTDPRLFMACSAKSSFVPPWDWTAKTNIKNILTKDNFWQ